MVKTQKQMDAIRDGNAAFARENPTGRKGLVGRCDKRALMEAVRREGSYILTEDGRGWWRDQEAKYPWLNTGKYRSGFDNAAGTATRFGRATLRCTAARGWERYEKGEWVKCSIPSKPAI